MKRFGCIRILCRDGNIPTSTTSTAAARRHACSTLTAAVWLAALVLCTAVSAGAQCQGPGAPTTTQTKCLTAILIPGSPLRSFDISWVDSERSEYYLGDRSNSGVDIIDTRHNVFKKRIGGFVGIKLLTTGPNAGKAVDNNHSGPDGVVSHGKWLYVGDGDSTLKVIDLDSGQIVATLSTGGTTRVDEMALTTDGKMLLVANNAEDPPFATLFAANGDDDSNSVTLLTKITADPAFVPAGAGLSMEQPAWDETTQRFIVSTPIIADNPAGCNYGQTLPKDTVESDVSDPDAIPCSGAILVIDPNHVEKVIQKDNVHPLVHCGPNGATVGPHDNVMVGCTPNNQKGDVETTIINATTFKYVDVGNLTGSDEVWYDSGSDRYYTGSSAMPGGAVLGVVDAETNFLLEAIPQSGASHSVAADRRRHEVFVPQVAPFTVVGIGGDKTPVGAGICGKATGCIAVYTTPHTEHDE